MVRAAMSILWQARMPLAPKDIALRIMADRGMSISDPGTLALFRRNVHACLCNQQHRGTIKKRYGTGQTALWEVMP
jgi:hypothetical protein